MTPRQRFHAAAPMTFLAWLVPLLVAAPSAWQGTRALWRWVWRHPEGIGVAWTPGAGPAVELLHRTATHDGDTLTLGLAGTMAAMALLTPWLAMAWLAALERPQPLHRCLQLGLARYVPALGATLLTGVAGLAALAATLLPPWAAHLALRSQPDARLHDLTVIATGLPALAVLLLLPTIHDLARGFLTHGTVGPVRAVARALRALRPGLVAAHVGYRLVGAALAAAAIVVALWPTLGSTAWATVVVLGQLAALARTAVRGRWLALAVHRTRPDADVTPGSGCPGSRAAGSTPPTR